MNVGRQAALPPHVVTRSKAGEDAFQVGCVNQEYVGLGQALESWLP